MPDHTPDFEAAYTRALYRSVKDAALLLNAILDVPIDHPLPFLLRERAAVLIDGMIRTLAFRNTGRKGDVRPNA